MNIWAETDCGLVRKLNQDAFAQGQTADERHMFFAVCDGMGGAKGGNIASGMAVDIFKNSVKKLLKPVMSANYIKNILLNTINDANNEIYKTAVNDKDLSGMGTTIVAGIASEEYAVIANVGDSRAYIIGEDGIRLVTKDHSVVAEMVERGELSCAEARIHPNKNLITRALGAEQSVQVDIFTIDMSNEKYILLCSDGLTNFVNEQEILYEIIYGGNTDDCCRRLINIANERGGTDNITVLIAEI